MSGFLEVLRFSNPRLCPSNCFLVPICKTNEQCTRKTHLLCVSSIYTPAKFFSHPLKTYVFLKERIVFASNHNVSEASWSTSRGTSLLGTITYSPPKKAGTFETFESVIFPFPQEKDIVFLIFPHSYHKKPRRSLPNGVSGGQDCLRRQVDNVFSEATREIILSEALQQVVLKHSKL